MKCVLFILVNWIIKLQEIVKGSGKTSAHFKSGNCKKKIFNIKSLRESQRNKND